MNDLRFAARQLLKSPGFSAVAVLMLALGIGANTVTFSFVQHLVLRPLAIPGLDRLVALHETDVRATGHSASGRSAVSPATFREWRQQATRVEELAAIRERSDFLARGDEALPVRAVEATAGFFPLLRGRPLLGRVFGDAESDETDGAVVVLSHGLWQRRFEATSEILGAPIELGGRTYTVVGVMRAGFDYPLGADLWLPLNLAAEEGSGPDQPSLQVLGALPPGVSLAQAQAEMKTIAGRLATAFPETHGDRTAVVEKLADQVSGRGSLIPMICAAGASILVLGLACANVSNVQLARSLRRRGELSIRVALGARRGAIVRLLLLETLWLAAGGGVLGTVLAFWVVEAMRAGMPADFARQVAGWSHVAVDVRALAASIAVTGFAGVMSGVAPALMVSHLDVNEALKEGSRAMTPSRGRQRTRNVLVAAEIALTLVLLCGAGILARTLVRLQALDPGVGLDRVLSWTLAMPHGHVREHQQWTALHESVLRNAETWPGVHAVAMAGQSPLSLSPRPYGTDEGEWPPGSRPPLALVNAVSPDYFRLLRIGLRSGRDFGPTDGPGTTPVAVVNEQLARRRFPDGDVLGRRLRFYRDGGFGEWVTIVGVVRDAPMDWDALSDEAVFLPAAQTPSDAMTFLARAEGSAESAAASIRTAVRMLDPDLRVVGLATLRDQRARQLSGLHFLSRLLGVLAVVALVLATVGIYGVASQVAAQRWHEVGIRMALGADRTRILFLMLRHGLRLAAFGFAVGLPAAWALYVVIAHQSSEVIFEPRVLSAVALGLGAAALTACWLPARRAARLDPMEALRQG